MNTKIFTFLLFFFFSFFTVFSQLPQIPAQPKVVNYCGFSVLYRTAAPAQTSWYWQGTNPSGTDLSNDDLTDTVYSDGTYYLMAYNSNGWSENSISVDVSIIQNPPAPVLSEYSIIQNCGNSTVSHITPSTDVSYFYQFGEHETNITGYSAQNDITFYSNQTIFLRARLDDYPHCWSDALPIIVSPVQLPQTPVATTSSDITDNSFTVNWLPVATAVSYFIDISTTDDFSTFVSGYENLDVGNVLSKNITGLNNAVSYYFRVRAYDGVCTSDNSNTILTSTLKLCPDEPEIYVYGNTYIIPNQTTVPDYVQNTFFGNVQLTQSKTNTFTISNKGNVALNLTGVPKISLTGADAGQFSVSLQPASPVISGGNVNFEITFSPTYVKPNNEQIQCLVNIQSDDPEVPLYSFTIGGFGVDNTTGPSNLEGDFSGSWVNTNTGSHRGLVRAFYVQAASSGNKQILFNLAPDDYDPKWGGGNINANTFYSNGAVLGAGNLVLNTSASYYYTAIISLNQDGNNDLCVLETDFLPNEITNVQRSPAGIVYPDDIVTVTVDLSGNRNANEYFFIRWTNDGWTTSNLSYVDIPVGTNTGTATIPVQSENTVLDFYALSAQSSNPDLASIDYFSLRINNSVNNSNYQYIVKSLPVVNASTPNTIYEGFENGASILVTITNGVFKIPFDISDWEVTNIPDGVSIDTIIEGCRTNQAYIILSGNSTADYDVQISSPVIISSDAFEGLGYSSDITAQQNIIFEPLIESAVLSSPSCLSNGNLNNAEINVFIENDFFIDNNLQISDFTLNNVPIGLSIENVSYIDKYNARLRLTTIFGLTADYDFNVTVSGTKLYGGENLTSNDLSINNIQSPDLQDESICGAGEITLTASNSNGNDVQFSYDGVNPVETVSSPYQFTTYSLAEGSQINVFARTITAEQCLSDWVEATAYANLIPSQPIVSNDTICGTQDYTIAAIIGNEGNSINFSLDGSNISDSDNSEPFEFTTTIHQNTTFLIYAQTFNQSTGCASEWEIAEIIAEEMSIVCPNDLVQNADDGFCNSVVTNITPLTSQDCGIVNQIWTFTGATTGNSVNTGINDASGQTFNTGTTGVSYRIEDALGNFKTCDFDVLIVDNQPPVPDVENITENCEITVNSPSATDNCGNLTGSTTDPVFYNQPGNYLINWSFNDGNGNVVTEEQIVSVVNVKPTAQTKDITVYLDANGYASITPQDIDDGSFDDCQLVSMTLDITDFDTTDIGENIVNLTVTDNAAQADTKSAVVTVLWTDVELAIPNFMSPDGDGKNDFWEIKGVEALYGYTLNIFNSLGEIIYTVQNYDNTWDATYNGKELPDGTYFYVFNNGSLTYKGYITVIR